MKLVLIDGNAILHRAYHALPSLTTRSGEPINAVYGLTSMLLRLIQDLNPTHLAVCFDRKEPTFRHKAYDKYQSQRPKMEEELSSQFEKAKDVLSSMNIPVYEKAGFEADDIIGTIAEKATENGKNNEVIIVTGDKDILQLVDDGKKIRVFLPKKGLSDTQMMQEKDVFEKLGVAPDQIIDYKALVGDPSDNYPGVKGIGPKTATMLLATYKTLNGIYEHINAISGNIRDKLKKDKKSADLSYKLATIIKDVPIMPEFEQMKRWRIDDPKLLELFKEYGFRTLTDRVKDVGKTIVGENQSRLF